MNMKMRISNIFKIGGILPVVPVLLVQVLQTHPFG